MRIRIAAAAGLAAALALTACSVATSGSASQSPQPAAVEIDPYATLTEVPDFSVTSETVTGSGAFALPQFSGVFGVEGGQDISPELTWSGFPEDTKSFTVSVYDVDAPTGSGFWHWLVTNIPATTTSLPEDAGSESGELLPEGATPVVNDAGATRFIGAAPPAGSGIHHYVVTVSALDVATLEAPPEASPALTGFLANGHTIARASLVVTAEQE